jgi:hypothetical protein
MRADALAAFRRILALGSASADPLGAHTTVRTGSCTVSKHVYGYRPVVASAAPTPAAPTPAAPTPADPHAGRLRDGAPPMRQRCASVRTGRVRARQDVLGEHRRGH